MRKIFVALAIALITVAAKADFNKPDFAYPQRVMEDATAMLENDASAIERLKAVMEIVKAKTSIDPDSLEYMPKFISQWASIENDEALRSLFLLYEAQTVQMSPNSSREMVDSLVDVAVAGIDHWGGAPLRKFRDVISIEQEATQFFPFVRDFVFAKAIELCPTKAAEFVAEASGFCTAGTPQWAYWECEKEGMDAQHILQLYNEYPKGVAGAYLLWRFILSAPYDLDAVKIELTEAYLKANGANVLTPTLSNRLNVLKAPTMKVFVPGCARPGEEFDVKIVHSFMSEAGIEVYRLKNANSSKPERIKVSVQSMSTNPELMNDTSTIRINLSNPGNYEIRGFSKEIKTSESRYVPTARITITDWLPFGTMLDNKFAVAVADYSSGNPLAGICVELSDIYGNDKKRPLKSLTNTQGIAFMTYGGKADTSNGGCFVLSKDNRTVVFDEGLWGSNWRRTDIIRQCAVFVERPLYHPGDTIGWSAVAVEKDYRKLSSTLMADKKLRATFFDANYEPLDTIEVISDSFGRVSGQFLVPVGRMSGNYRISLSYDREIVGSAYVVVSDFKMPVFEIKDLRAQRDDSCYIITGNAIRYSGAAVPDAKVDVNIAQAFLWGWMPGRSDFHGIEVEGKTKADGSFKIEIPASDMPPSDGFNFQCTATVTSLNGDMASASTMFRVGKPFFFAGGLSNRYLDGSAPVVIPVKSIGSDLQVAPMCVIWSLSKDNKEIYKGETRTDSIGIILDLSNAICDKYDLKIFPAAERNEDGKTVVLPDTTICDVLDLGEVWLYNTVRNELPEELPLVVPQKIYKDVSGNSVKILFGAGRECYIYSFGYENNGEIKAESQKYSPGFHFIEIPVDTRHSQEVVLTTVADGTTYSENIHVERVSEANPISIRGICWRDNLSPGKAEEWTLHLSQSDGKAVEGAMILTMYNASLNALGRKMNWPNLSSIISAPVKPVNQQFAKPSFGISSFRLQASRNIYGFSVLSPQFLYLPEESYSFAEIYYGSSRKLMARSDLSANMATTSGMATDSAVEEAFEAEAGVATDDADEMEVDYRDSETLQALWMPSISTSADGEAVIRFIMPNALGKWDLYSTAWTRDLRCAELVASFITSKPVMIEPSLPRFLRQGDRATIGATVINNTDSTANIATVVEIFDTANGDIISTTSFSNVLGSKSQNIIYVDVEAPIGVESLGYRVSSSNGEFTDGEQSIIPVLEANTTAIDSEIFYLDSSDRTISVNIPADKSGEGIVAIQYCQNPVWDVIKALPGLYEDTQSTATSAANAVYAALTALDLYNKYPEIANVLEIWQSQPSDSSLVSNLFKNEDLKLATLAQTPFVGAANANTAQMERLGATFDKKVIDRVLLNAIGKLETLQRPDGGFSWGTWADSSSMWITQNVLSSIGRILNKDLLRENKKLRAVVDRAFGYIDRSITKGDADLRVARIYSLYPYKTATSQAAVQAIDKTVQNILSTWKSHSNSQKAEDALILQAFHNKSSALEILKSVEQFAVNSSKKGVVFPSVTTVDSYASLLNAFNILMPESQIIEGMKKWLVLRTQSTDDLGAWDPVTLIASMLPGSSHWISFPTLSTAYVTIDGQPVTVNKVEAATGAFCQRLPSSSTPRKATFSCAGGVNIAYGSVTSISTVPLSEVKPHAVDGLSVSKAIYVYRNGTWTSSNDIKIGEKIRVDITVDNKNVMEYVTIIDQRPAAIEPTNQLPHWNGGAYCEHTDFSTNMFVEYLPKGRHTFSYEAIAAYAGDFASGTATVQSQFSPSLTARSGAKRITIVPTHY